MKKIRMKVALFFISITLIVVSCGGSKEKYTLVYNLNKGDVFKQVIMMDMNISQNVMGQKMDIDTYTEVETSYYIHEVNEETIALDFIFDSMNMAMDMAGVNFTMDSRTNEDVATMTNLSPMLKSLTNLPLSIVMDHKGNVKSFTGLEKIMEAMVNSLDNNIDPASKQQLLTQFEQQFGAESMQSTFEQSITIFPEHEVSIGESWKSSSKINSGQINMYTDTKTTLKRVSGNVAVLEIKGEFSTGDTPITQITNGMETKVSLKGKQTGTTEIDLLTGWIIKAEIVQDMKTEVEAAGMKLPQNIINKVTIESN